ncbi:MAG: iron-sulfur cluster assembly scaffold protein [Gammaproteobacteria bacterium]
MNAAGFAMRYTDQVMSHFRAPRNAGRLAPGPGVGCGEAGRAAAGTLVRFWLRMDTTGRIAEARWQALGDPWTIAAASVVSERLAGADEAAIERLAGARLGRELGFPVENLGNALIVEDAVRAAWAACRPAAAPSSVLESGNQRR